jgi:hypothetical protein
MSSQAASQKWDDGLKLISYCPSCENRMNPMQAHLLGEDDETQLLHVTCGECKNAILAVVLTNQSGMSSVGLMTDLSFEDVPRFQNKPGITIDDVIDIHAFLEGDTWKSLYQSVRKMKVQTKKVKKKTL